MVATAWAKRVAYGATFVVGVPALLVLWARRSAPLVPLPAWRSVEAGLGLAVLGLALMLAGMHALWRFGGGLPMNAFPPPVHVRQGVYRWLRDPIYVGFGILVAGVALASGSAAGLWLVAPVTWLAMAALVFGYERHDLRRRFGTAALAPSRLSLPRGDGTPAPIERVATLLKVFVPWLLAYYAVQGLGRPPDAFTTALPFERGLPVVTWMEWLYVSAYLVVPLACFAARDRRALRTFAMGGLAATVFVTLCWLLVPVVAANRAFVADGLAARLLAAEQSHSNRVAAFPAFHVLWPLLAARACSAGRPAGWRALAWGWAWAVALASFATGHHTVIEVLAGAVLYLPFRDPARTWELVRRATERIANSWHEWRLGPVRVINHGVYAGTGAAIGLLLAGSAAGPGREVAVAWVGLCVLIGAGAYAQVLEGSSMLLRPFGWYGGFIGGIVGVLTASLAGVPILALMAAFVLAAPWIQILGRLRCLVQGCCHGGPAPAAAGIVYRHRRSRVNHIAHLAGVPVHPTPLFSIAGNVVIGLVLLRLRSLAAPDTLVLGVYFMLAALARFVEESYRGEPQTPVVARLHVYQWFAVAQLLAGVAFTMFPTPPVTGGLHPPSNLLLATAAGVFVVFTAAMGVDFPASNRRFSRLAAAD